MPCLHLITLGSSHFSEKARWALQRSSSPFKETAHVPALHRLFLRKMRGGTRLPKLIITDETGAQIDILLDSSHIVAFADTLIQSQHLRLYPPLEKSRISSWEYLFDNVLGPNVRQWIYCHILYHKGILYFLTYGASIFKKIAAFLILPVIQRGLHKRLKCWEANAKDASFRAIVAVFEKVGEALADGGSFICGDSFTAADLTFASLGAPAVLPRGYGGRPGGSPYSIEWCPSEMAKCVLHLRELPAGQHIMKLYETQRYKSVM